MTSDIDGLLESLRIKEVGCREAVRRARRADDRDMCTQAANRYARYIAAVKELVAERDEEDNQHAWKDR